MGRVITRCIVCLFSVAVLIAASAASAALFVDFENDLAPVNVLNGFESSDSSLIHFSDTDDTNSLIVLDFDGSHAMGVLNDDDSGLLMEFDFVASALSLEIGNTSTAISGDTAVLTVFSGVNEVGSAIVVLNGTDAIDQTISYAGASFDSAILRYNVAAGLTEVVDNIQVSQAARTIPEPGAGYLFGMGALLVGAACGGRSRREIECRAMRG
jgi:hypothetical protein